MVPLTFAIIGCGSRGRTYAQAISRTPDRYQIVAVADPNPDRVARLQAIAGNESVRVFANDRELLTAGKLADIVIITTQDADHVQPCAAAMAVGYDVILEKPIAPTFREVRWLETEAERLGRRVLVCHILRYTPFYTQIKALLDSGAIGRIATVTATEGVGPFHQAHSYVRGHWSVVENCTPMIIAKCSHDLDILSWLIEAPCERVSSFGSLAHFTARQRPVGAPDRCIEGCPVAATCDYDAQRYLTDQRHWLQWVFDGGVDAPDDAIKDWLRTSPWGRCVYHGENTAVDRQVVAMEFTNDVTATLTMTAFDTGRSLEVRGTDGVLRAGSTVRDFTGHDIALTDHRTGRTIYHDVPLKEGEYAGHGGGDEGLIEAVEAEWRNPNPAQMRSSLQRSVESHAMGFAAEDARLSGAVISMETYRRQHQ